MKKKRGLKRYFTSLQFRQLQVPKLWINDGYFSYDKIWVDYSGFKGVNKRKPHIECLIRNFDTIADQVARLNLPFQVWIWIHEKSGSEDCIILHSPNPFTSFPHKYENLSLSSNFKDAELSNYIAPKTGFKKLFGVSFCENDNGGLVQENFCILYKDVVGEPVA